MKIEILRPAEDELTEAVEYYEEIEPGLGIRLKEEARQCLRWIRSNACLPRVRQRGYRRVNFKTFPYYVVYFVWDSTIWVLAFAHARRMPEYWMGRTKKI